MTKPPLTFEFDQSFSSCESSEPSRNFGFARPSLSAYNQETEGDRIPRLATTWGQACATVALLSNRYQHHWDGAIVAMNDHKGTLEVTWRDEQSRVIFEGVIMGAWERECEHAGCHAVAERESING